MKIGQIINMDSFRRLRDSSQARGFTDSAGGVVLARNLTALDPQMFKKLYPALTFTLLGITVDNTGGYASQIESLRTIVEGEFANTNDPDANKGKITLRTEDSMIPVHGLQAHSIWSDDDIQKAKLQGRNLVAEFIEGHREKYMQKIDTHGFVGILSESGALKYAGLFNNSHFTSTSAGDNVEDLTGNQAFDAVAGLITDQWNGVNNTPGYMADKVAMPVRVINELGTKEKTVDNNVITVLEALKKRFPTVGLFSTTKAENVVGVGTSVTTAFASSDQAMKMRIPTALTVGQIVRMSSFDFRIDTKYRVAGLDILESTAGRSLTGL